MVEKIRPSYTFTEDRLEQLKVVVPEAFADGKINWDVLREALGDHLEDEEKERFGLFWPGKREARRLAVMPSKGTLVPLPKEGVSEEITRNIFIEGENLEVLKILLKSYAGRVQMIYIDPPYNTGKDFIYTDDFKEPLDIYLARTGQLDKTGELLSSNKRGSGRYHSLWLSMMFPRLLLARQMLSDSGVIMISIDSNEVHHLRQLMNEVFGEENYIVTIIWKKRTTPPNDKIIGAQHEYIVLFGKNIEKTEINLRPRSKKQLDRYKNPDNHPKGPWTPGDLMANVKGGRYVESLFFPIVNPNTGEEHFPGDQGNWRFNQSKIMELLRNDEIYFGKDGQGKPKLKRFLINVKEGITWTSLWDFVPVNTQGSLEMEDIFGSSIAFENPKPSGLLKELIKLGSRKNDLVLDFFAGSATVAQAIYELNIEDKFTRRFLLVQLPEPIRENSPAYKLGYPTIAEIGKERIRRVICQLSEKYKEIENVSEGTTPLSFKVLKLTKSNFSDWQNYQGGDIRNYQMLLTKIAGSPLIEGWKEQDVLNEVMLLQGFPLESEISILQEYCQNTVRRIHSDFHEFNLYICFDESIFVETAEQLNNLSKEDVFICLDSSLSDELKMRLDDALNLYVI